MSQKKPGVILAVILLSLVLMLSVAPPLQAVPQGGEGGIEELKKQMAILLEKASKQEEELRTLRAEQQELRKRVSELAEGKPNPSRAAVVEGAPSTAPSGAIPPATNEELTQSPSARAAGFRDRVKLGGYGSVRFETNNIDGQPFVPSGSASGFTFRRFVLTTDAKLTNRLHIYSETEFERLFEIEIEKRARPDAGGTRFVQAAEGNNGGEIAIEQLWAQYDFAENHGFRMGVLLPPVGRFNILHDDDYWDIPRRTLTDRDAPVLPVKSAWRELGAGLVGRFDLSDRWRMDYHFYVVNGSTLDFNLETVAQTRTPARNKLAVESEVGLTSGAFDGSQSARAVTWRAAFSPTLASEFAFSGYHGKYTPRFLNVSEPLHSLAFDGKWRRGGFEAEGEFVYTTMGRIQRVLNSFAQQVVNSSAETSSAEAAELETEIEFELSDLARTRKGFWTDFKYHWRPVFLKKTFLGKSFEDPQLIPILRYERVWLNRNIQGLEFQNGLVTAEQSENLSQDRITLGLSYRPVREFGIQAAYEHNQRRSGSRLVFPRVPITSSDGFLLGMVFAF